MNLRILGKRSAASGIHTKDTASNIHTKDGYCLRDSWRRMNNECVQGTNEERLRFCVVWSTELKGRRQIGGERTCSRRDNRDGIKCRVGEPSPIGFFLL